MSGQKHADRHQIVAGFELSASSLAAIHWAVRQAELTGGAVDALLGSVSQHCSHRAPCPVVVIRGQSQG